MNGRRPPHPAHPAQPGLDRVPVRCASRLTALIYRNATGQLGDLTYKYDPPGNRTGIGGSWARTGLPTAIASAGYDAANRQLTFGGQMLAYDANGSLVSRPREVVRKTPK